MSTTTENTPDETPTTAEAEDAFTASDQGGLPKTGRKSSQFEDLLPDYAGTVSELGDPQPTIEALSADLHAQTPPVIDPDPDAGAEDSDEADGNQDGGDADD